MSLLLEKLGQCVMAIARDCQVLFPRIPNVDPGSQACLACKGVAYKAIMRVLHANGKEAVESAWAALDKIRAPKAWMFCPDILGAFVCNIGGVDDDRWTRWWKANGMGKEENPGYPSHRAFFDRVVSRHAMSLRVMAQAKLAKAEAPKPAPVLATNEQVLKLAETLSTRHEAQPKLDLIEEPTIDVGDLQPDVALPTAEEHMKTLGDINAMPAAESFEPAPQAPAIPSADEVRATSGPAMERRKGDAPARTKLARSRASVRVKKETAPAPMEEQAKK